MSQSPGFPIDVVRSFAAKGLAESGIESIRPRSPEGAIRSIFVPLDGSRHAEHALPQALAIAARNRSFLRIAQAYSYCADADKLFGFWSEDNPVLAVRTPREHYLQSITQRISRVHQVPVIATLLEGSDPAGQLKDLQRQTDLTVMTSRRRGWLSRVCRESMVDSLLNEADHPVLLVRGYDAPVDLTGAPLRRHILVPVDDAHDAVWLVDELRRYVSSDVLQVTILPLTDKAATAAATLNEPALRPKWATRFDLQIEPHRFQSAASLLAFTEAHDVDLLAVNLPRGFGGLPWFGESLLPAVVRQARLPLLIHHRAVPPAVSAGLSSAQLPSTSALEALG